MTKSLQLKLKQNRERRLRKLSKPLQGFMTNNLENTTVAPYVGRDFYNLKCDNCGGHINRSETVQIEAGYLDMLCAIYKGGFNTEKNRYESEQLYDFDKYNGLYFCSFACIVQYLCNDLTQALKEYETK